ESVTTSALASLYYEHVISTLGRVTIRGESMGGMIAQHLALQHPSHVARLILVATGYRISDYAAGAMHRWELLARNLAWDDLYLDMARELYAGWRDEVPKHYD
ncbi:MAG: alpha/beta fold hydrolase, partial [Phycisphaerae bacterium]